MKILHTVEFYWPSIGGAQEVVRQLSERMAVKGHDVTVATTRLPERTEKTHNGVKIEEFGIHGNTVRGMKGEITRYKDFLINSNFDVVMNYAAQQWATDLFFEVIDKVKAGKILVPCGYSGLYDPDYKNYFKKLSAVLKKYDASIYLSEDYRDINFAREHKVRNLYVIPNGAGADEFSQKISFDIRQKLSIPQKSFLILTVGSHTGVKGHQEAIDIFMNSSLRNACLLILANGEDGCAPACKLQARRATRSIKMRLKGKKILVKNLPRIETVAAYKAADLFLLASRIEASPLVLFEAMASKTAFLTTDVGNALEIIKWSGGGLALPTSKDDINFSHADIEKSASILEDIASHPQHLAKLANSGYKAWKKRFSWEIITDNYLNVYRKAARQ